MMGLTNSRQRRCSKWLRRHAETDSVWLLSATLVGSLVSGAYLATHPYPAFGAGLFLRIAERVLASGYHLPAVIPGYTSGGVPFAYPPLMFYVTAVLLDFGVDGLVLSRYLPAVVTVLYLVPYYYLARAVLDDHVTAGVSTVLLAVTPPVLQWHLSAGGLVRAPAFLFALTGCYTGVRLFRSHDPRWLVASTLLFLLTVLTHPVYTVFFGLSYVWFFLVFDRSVTGLLAGATVAAGGVALASPWWFRVLSVHGPSIFTSAAGTHTGLFGGPERLLDQFVYPLVTGPPLPAFFVGAFAGAFYLLGERRVLLPGWLALAAVVLGKERFQFVAGSMMIAVFLVEVLKPSFELLVRPRNRRTVARATLAVVCLSAVGVGVLYAGGALDAAHHGDPSQPQFIAESDVRAMQWARSNTPPSADFVVLGDAAEWFPLLAHRTILVGPWGVEWTSPAQYRAHLDGFRAISTCDTARCVTTEHRKLGVAPDYVYVPRDHYTVRGLSHEGNDELVRSLVASDRYLLVFRNNGVAIFEVTEGTRGPEPSEAVDAGRC